MTEKEIRQWMVDEDAEDLWKVSVDGKPLPDPRSLAGVLKLELPAPESLVEILHASQWQTKDPAWVDFDIHSKLSDKKRAQLHSHKGRRKRRLRTVKLQIAVILAVIIIFIFLLRHGDAENVAEMAPAVAIDPMEAIFARIDEQRRTRPPTQMTDSGIPKLDGQIVVARSDRLVFIANLTDQEWASCEVILNPDSGYAYFFAGPIQPRQTLYEPMRSFVRNGNSFEYHQDELVEVLVRVPGFAEWRDRF